MCRWMDGWIDILMDGVYGFKTDWYAWSVEMECRFGSWNFLRICSIKHTDKVQDPVMMGIDTTTIAFVLIGDVVVRYSCI